MTTWNQERISVQGTCLHFLKKNVRVQIVDQVVLQERETIRVLKIDRPIIELKAKVVSLVDLLSPLPRGPVVLQQIDERLQSYNDVAIHLNISEIKEDIQKLLQDCNYLVETLGEELLRSRIAEYHIDWDALYCIIEKYEFVNQACHGIHLRHCLFQDLPFSSQ
jgi:hypothetical protein